MNSPRKSVSDGDNDYASREQALFQRVADAAQELTDRGIPPTNKRVRAALKGGSPNDIAPALKAWKESRAAATRDVNHTPIPLPIADLAHELWQRATVAAAVELKGGPTARALALETAEAEALRQQIHGLRHELEREMVLYGELRAQAARHEAIARDALNRLEASEARERKQLRDLGGARQRIAELEATATQRRERPVARKAARSSHEPTVRGPKSPTRRKPIRPRPNAPPHRPHPPKRAASRTLKSRGPTRRRAPKKRKRR